MKIYIACGLTHVPRFYFKQYVRLIHRLAKTLSHDGNHDVSYALVNSDPQLAERPFGERAGLCYQWDRDMVEQADIVIAEASFPSTGLGIELQIAEAKKIPVLLAFRKKKENKADPIEYENPDHSLHSLQIGEGFISLMALGLPNIIGVIAYSDASDGVSQVAKSVCTFGSSFRTSGS